MSKNDTRLELGLTFLSSKTQQTIKILIGINPEMAYLLSTPVSMNGSLFKDSNAVSVSALSPWDTHDK